MKNKGFTLIELLVVTAVIGILGVMSAVIISSILRSQNKTAIINEVRQNGDLVISKFERDVKQSSEISVVGGGTSGSAVSLLPNGIDWNCTGTEFTRENVSLINTDLTNGVAVESCTFTVSGAVTGVPQIVTLDFRLRQRNLAGNQEFHISEHFIVTVGTRLY